MNEKSLGERLREARVLKSFSLYDVEKNSGIESQYLLALEMDQLKVLPKEIQEQAVKQYAEAVGLDGEHLYLDYLEEQEQKRSHQKQIERQQEDVKKPLSRFAKHKREEQRKSTYLPLIILSCISFIIVCSVGYIIYRHLSDQASVIHSSATPTVEQITTRQDAVESNVSEVAVDGAKIETRTKGNKMTITLKDLSTPVTVNLQLKDGETWFELTNSDLSGSRLLSKDSQRDYKINLKNGAETSQLTIGQASVVTLKINDQTIDLSKLDSDTLSYLTLKMN